jgi:hypothetical protein
MIDDKTQEIKDEIQMILVSFFASVEDDFDIFWKQDLRNIIKDLINLIKKHGDAKKNRDLRFLLKQFI